MSEFTTDQEIDEHDRCEQPNSSPVKALFHGRHLTDQDNEEPFGTFLGGIGDGGPDILAMPPRSRPWASHRSATIG